MSGYCLGFLQKTPEFCDNGRQSNGIVGRKYTDYAINRGEVAPTFRSRPEHREGSAHADVAPTGTCPDLVGRSAHAEVKFSTTKGRGFPLCS